MPYQKKETKPSKEDVVIPEKEEVLSMTNVETTPDEVSVILQKEEELIKELEDIKEMKYKVTEHPVTSEKSIAELIREQRILRNSAKDNSEEKKKRQEANLRNKLLRRPGSSRYNPIVIGGSNK